MTDIPKTETGGDVPSDPNGADDGGLLSGLVSGRQALALVAIAAVVALLLWRMRSGSSSDGGQSEAAAEVEEALEGDLSSEVRYEDADGDGDAEIIVPVDPEDELDKDAAVLEALKESGKMEGE